MVKKLLLPSLLLLCANATQAQTAGQDKITDFHRAKILKFNIFSPVVETVTLAYENVLSPEKSFQLTLSFFEFGFVVTPEYRFYLSETAAPTGVYVAPYLRYYQLDDNEFETNSIFGGGVVIGTQRLYKQKITIDAFIGPSASSINPFEEEEISFGIRAGLTLGINLSAKKNK
jgi:hypothetical protein